MRGKKKSKVLQMMDDIRDKKNTMKAPDAGQIWEPDPRNTINKVKELQRKSGKPLTQYKPFGSDKPSARKKRIVGEGKEIKRKGWGLIEYEVGGKTTAQNQIKHPAFEKRKKGK